MKGHIFRDDISSGSDIPEEHMNGFRHNEYMRQYKLNIIAITWNRDSEGLFDYDTRTCVTEKMSTIKSCLMVRNVQKCGLHPVDTGVKELYDGKGQVLMRINKVRNYYEIESVDQYKMEQMNGPQKQEYMKKDVDAMYNEESGGSQNHPAYEMNEKAYLIVRNMTDQQNKAQFGLQKQDIIKLGRIKFRVQNIFIKKLDDSDQIKKLKQDAKSKAW